MTQRLDYRTRKQIKIPIEEWKFFECKDKIPQIVPEELWDRCNEILKKRGDSYKNKQENKAIFANRYAFTSLIYCPEHEELIPFHRVAGEKRANRPTYACRTYIKGGLKECESPILVEEELYIIMKSIIKVYVDNKAEIIDDLIKRYEEININKNYEKDIRRLEDKIKETNQKKDKLLELTINGHIDNNEFSNRNEAFNKDIEEHKENIRLITIQKDDIQSFKKNIDELDNAISDELNFEENIDMYIKLLIDKIIVHKINGDRKHVKLDIKFKLGDSRSIDYHKNETLKKKYLLSCHHQDTHSNSIVRTWKFKSDGYSR